MKKQNKKRTNFYDLPLFNEKEVQQLEYFLEINLFSFIPSKRAVNFIRNLLIQNSYVELWASPEPMLLGDIRMSIRIDRNNHFGYTRPYVEFILKKLNKQGKFDPPVVHSFVLKPKLKSAEPKLQKSFLFQRFISQINKEPRGFYDQHSNKKTTF